WPGLICRHFGTCACPAPFAHSPPTRMAGADYPKVSIIVPTLNAGALLDNCLASIAAQTYPRDRIEIILADAFSKDATRDIARKYGATIIDDPGKNMEEGKRLALR